MSKPIEILLQTTIEPTSNDWHIGRFSMLRDYLASLSGKGGSPLFSVTARDRGPLGRPDPVLSTLDTASFDELYILWPNFHSGANGDAQRIEPVLPVHPVLRDPESETGALTYLPAHPHEGAVAAPPAAAKARVIATSRSLATGNRFNIAVAFEASGTEGRAIAESTFHHFADYNWDPSRGSPDFVSEPAGDGLARDPRAMASVHRYVRNMALWLAGIP